MFATLFIVIILATFSLGAVSVKQVTKVQNSNLTYAKSEANSRGSNDDYKFHIAC